MCDFQLLHLGKSLAFIRLQHINNFYMAEKKEDIFDFPDIEFEEKDLKPEDYTCSATQAFDAVFQCYSTY